MRSEELDSVYTAIFGRVKIHKVFRSEAKARAEGYYYDAHAYRINQFGGVEPVSWKVFYNGIDSFCLVMSDTHKGHRRVRNEIWL